MRPPRYTVVATFRVSRFQPTAIPQGAESPGQRLARVRKERGVTQKELATRTGLLQALISDYERDKLRLNAEMILRFATAQEITTGDLLQPCGPKPARKPGRSVLRRLEQIETLPPPHQATPLKTTDTFWENAFSGQPRRA